MEAVGQDQHPFSWSKSIVLTGLGSVLGAWDLPIFLLNDGYQHIISMTLYALLMSFLVTTIVSCRRLPDEA